MKVLIAGASGLIGTALVAAFRGRGDEVHTLVRRAPANSTEHSWDPVAGSIAADLPQQFDAVINLSGASIGKLPWSARYRRELVDSRLAATRTVASAILSKQIATKVFVSASGSGFYGNRGDETLTESSSRGGGFLAGLCEQWEAEARKADSATRVVAIRTGVVLAPRGGALARLLPLVKLGVGGPLGTGKQWWPWITLTDEVNAIIHLASSTDSASAYNLVSPESATNAMLTRELGAQLHRPTLIAAPAFALRLVLGEAADEVLLASTKIEPKRLTDAGFSFTHPDLKSAVRYVLGK